MVRPKALNVQEQVAACVDMLQRKSYRRRQEACSSLTFIAMEAELAVEPLVSILQSDDMANRYGAMSALSMFSSISLALREVISAIVDALSDPSPDTRAYAASALGLIGVGNCRVTSSLLMALEDDNALVRSAACGALGRLFPPPKTAIRALAKATRDLDVWVRAAALWSLATLRQKPSLAVKPLSAFLIDNREALAGAHYLAKFGRQAKSAVSNLLIATKNRDFVTRSEAVRALGSIGWEAKIAIPTLKTILRDDEEPVVRQSAAIALKAIVQRKGANQKAALKKAPDNEYLRPCNDL